MITIATLTKPCSSKERADFIVKFNHQQGLQIEENDSEIKALDFSDTEKEAQEQLAKDEAVLKGNEETLKDLIERMAIADLQGNDEWKAELRTEYAELMGE